MTTKNNSAYSIAHRADALDFMAEYPSYGEQRWYSDALGTEQVSFSWRQMPPGTGGRGSYGHCHPGQEEIYFVISGIVTFKVGDEVFEAAPQTAVRMTGTECYSLHNDTDTEAELLIFSTRLAGPPLQNRTTSGRNTSCHRSPTDRPNCRETHRGTGVPGARNQPRRHRALARHDFQPMARGSLR